MRTDNSNISEIFKDLSFSEEEIKILETLFHKIEFKKGDIIIKTGDTVKNMYYILSGCLRTYHIDKLTKEHTVQFGIKDWWITDFTAFFTESKAIMNLEVLSDATVYSLSRDDRESMFSQIPKTEKFIRLKFQNAYGSFQKRILRNLSQTASERYTNFIKNYPTIEKSVKNYHIASYLGITKESLSRIRKELSNN